MAGMTIEMLADAVRSNFKQLDESQVIARISLISGRSLTRSIVGYKLIVEKNLLPKGFIINFQTFTKYVEKNPHILELFERWDMIPVKLTIEECTNEFVTPKMLTREEALKAFNITPWKD